VGGRRHWPSSQERIAEVEQGVPAAATSGILRRAPGGESGKGSGIHGVQFAIRRRSVVAGQVHPGKELKDKLKDKLKVQQQQQINQFPSGS
jgi:hypothetical protein